MAILLCDELTIHIPTCSLVDACLVVSAFELVGHDCITIAELIMQVVEQSEGGAFAWLPIPEGLVAALAVVVQLRTPAKLNRAPAVCDEGVCGRGQWAVLDVVAQIDDPW